MTVPFGIGSCRLTATRDIPIGAVGLYTSVALGSDGRPHISYYDESGGDLRYAVWDGAAWRVEVVDSEGAVGFYTSLELGHPGQSPHQLLRQYQR